MEAAAKKTIIRIELWHTLLLMALLALVWHTGWLDSKALVIGGVFMGVNFLFLSYGVAWVLTPLAGKGRIKAGLAMLVVKFILFLGLLLMLFARFELDAVSFALGFSTLIIAIVIETMLRVGTAEP